MSKFCIDCEYFIKINKKKKWWDIFPDMPEHLAELCNHESARNEVTGRPAFANIERMYRCGLNGKNWKKKEQS